MRAGHDCPPDLAREALAGEPLFECQSLYVVGGLHGNRQALAAVAKRLAAEPGARLVFNGAVHGFDRAPEIFQQIEQGVGAHLALRGASETALVRVAGQRVAISPGDKHSLSRESLSEPARQQQLNDWLQAHNIRVLASGHSSAAVAISLEQGALIDNGAAGLPNFAGGRYGLLSRIASTPHPAALYRCQRDGLFIEALPLNYDHAAFLADFDRQWPAHSPAAQSYRPRILGAVTDQQSHALLAGFSLCQSLCALEALTDE